MTTEKKFKNNKKNYKAKPAGKSLCPVHGKCGGCQLLDMPYEQQLKKNRHRLRNF